MLSRHRNENNYCSAWDLIASMTVLLILFSSIRGLYFRPFTGIHELDTFSALCDLITGFASHMLVFLFLQNGATELGPALSRLDADRFSVIEYIVERSKLVFGIVYPAILLSAALYVLGSYLFPSSRFYLLRPLPPVMVTPDWSWPQLICNLSGLGGLGCAPLGIDPPLGTFGQLWGLYLTAPFFVLALGSQKPDVNFRVRQPLWLRLGAGALVGLTIIILSAKFVWAAVWVLGGIAASRSDRMLPRWVGPIGLAVSACMLLATRFAVLHLKFIEFGAALALALSVAAIHPNTRFSCTPLIKRC